MTLATKILAVALASVIALLAAPVAPAGGTLRVGPGQAYRTIQGAIDRAAPGAVVLVDIGEYSEDLVIGAGITVAGMSGTPTVLGQLDVQRVPAGQAAHVSGLRFQAPAATGSRAVIRIQGCSGHVRLQRVSVVAPTPLSTGSSPAVCCADSADVFLVGCDVQGSNGFATASIAIEGEPALHITGRARVLVTGSTLRGGTGSFGFTAGRGGPACRVDPGAHLDAADSDLIGGTGGDAFEYYGASGGPGLELPAGGSANLWGIVLAGGPGGSAPATPDGARGPASEGHGSLTVHPEGPPPSPLEGLTPTRARGVAAF